MDCALPLANACASNLATGTIHVDAVTGIADSWEDIDNPTIGVGAPQPLVGLPLTRLHLVQWADLNDSDDGGSLGFVARNGHPNNNALNPRIPSNPMSTSSNPM